VTAWDPAQRASTANLPSITVLLYARQLRFDVPVSAFIGPHWSKRATQRQLERVAAEFPFLRYGSTTGPEETPYRLVIEATHATGGSKRMNTISRFTKYLIPCAEESAVELEARLSREGAPLKTYEAVGRYQTKRHLLFLLVPMRWNLSAPGETTADTFRDLFLQVERDAAALLTGGAGVVATERPL
jgi:hypothetical protein